MKDSLIYDDVIVVKNLRGGYKGSPYTVKVDRSSPLGNPFFMKDESHRDEVCDKYKDWLLAQIKENNRSVCDELNRLIKIVGTYDKLELYCWCAPKRCHAEFIKEMLLEKL